MFETEWPVFSETYGVDLEGKSRLLEIGFDTPCPTLTQHQVVGGCAHFVSTSFKDEMCGTVMLQLFDVRVQDREGIDPDRVLIEIKQHVLKDSPS